MPKLKVKSPGQRMQIKLHLSSGEHWDEKQRQVIESMLPAGFMRLESLRGKNAFFTAPADTTFDRYIASGLDRVSFYICLTQLVNAFRNIERLHLTPANLQLDPQWITINCRSKEIYFLYQPINPGGGMNDPRRLLAAIGGAAEGHGTEPQAVEELRRIIMMPGPVRTADLEALVVRFMPHMKSGFIPGASQNQYAGGGADGRAARAGGTLTMDDYMAMNGGMNGGMNDGMNGAMYGGMNGGMNGGMYGGTVAMNDGFGAVNDGFGENTTVLDFNNEVYRAPVYVGILTRNRTGETIRIDKDVFRLGSSQSSADYRLTGNPAISRAHADMIRRDGRFYIYDTNSTNGTFVGGQRLPAMQETEVGDGETLRLANEDFQFQIVQE